MTDNFDYKNFYDILKIENVQDKENQLKDLIDSYLCFHFTDNRVWFNTLFYHGLINVIYHCERTIPYFYLYNNQ